ncbi:MAG: type II secretion system protein [Armatimonadetes bacterium]|nr:type II secretion system protein [Armatimonadota bacterium]
MERRALTLPELLVVVTIVAVLARLLMPVFASARKRALIGVSTSNLRQLAQAQNLYLADSDGREPVDLQAVDPYVKEDRIYLSPLDPEMGFNMKLTKKFGKPVSYFWSNSYLGHFGGDLSDVAVFVDVLIGEQVRTQAPGQLGSYKGNVLRAMRDTSVKSKPVPHKCADAGGGQLVGRPFWVVFTDRPCPPGICPAGSTDCEPSP